MSRRPPSKPRRLPRRERVVVSWLFPSGDGKVSGWFMSSMLNLFSFDVQATGGRVLSGGWLPMMSGPNLSSARNRQASQFLDDKDADWLLIVDSDMTFAPDALERVLAEADPVKAPVVGGLCFGKHPKLDGSDEYWATMYGFDTSGDSIKTFRYEAWPEDTMFQVNATGTAFLLIHRTVLEAVRDKFADRAPWIWFEEMNNGGYVWGEDTTFCLRAQQCGFPVFVHTGVEVGHMKPEAITADTFRKWKATS